MKINQDTIAYSVLFFIIGSLAVVVIGLTANRIAIWNGSWPSHRIRSDMIYLLFCGCWTALGAFVHWLYPLVFGFFWSFITCFLWLAAAILYYVDIIRFHNILFCSGSTCAQLRTLNVLAWTEMGLLFLASLVICCSWGLRRENRNFIETGYDGMYSYPSQPSNTPRETVNGLPPEMEQV